MKDGLKKYCPDSIMLLVCAGDIYAQAGDAGNAILLYELAYKQDPTFPLPLINAARVYQQLTRETTARSHLLRAVQL